MIDEHVIEMIIRKTNFFIIVVFEVVKKNELKRSVEQSKCSKVGTISGKTQLQIYS